MDKSFVSFLDQLVPQSKAENINFVDAPELSIQEQLALRKKMDLIKQRLEQRSYDEMSAILSTLC
ncbi:MAG: hypothetical protein QM652_13560 [Legionella sp.]|uniref:hypothetical protein n=1 Tax=Legionella sp. TaxID=459 RepID=UPI0039E249AB